MDPDLMPPADRERRHHIILPMGSQPKTEAARIMHADWHEWYGPEECGTWGCGFLGQLLAVEAEAYDAEVLAQQAMDSKAEGVLG